MLYSTGMCDEVARADRMVKAPHPITGQAICSRQQAAERRTLVTTPLLFLSHAGVDSEAALQLADVIEASPAAQHAGLKVWIDKRSLVPGTSWQQQLEDAIGHRSTAFAIYLSAAGAEHWVRIEVRAALDRLIADGRNGVAYPFIPVIAADAGDIAQLPRFAQQYQGVSLQDEQGLQKLIGAVLGTTPEERVPLVDEPFRGLEAFDADDAHLFFGRDRETGELIERLQRNGLIVVVGDSGSGKSSLVKAGLVPRFREGLLADRLAPRPLTSSWHVVQMRPLNAPLEALISGVSNAARNLAGLNTELLGSAIARLRSGDPAAVVDVLREGAPADARVLLVIDQFEELWTQTTDEALRNTFLSGVLSATTFSDLRFRVVATMRRDYYFQAASHDELRERLDAPQREARYNLRRMTEEQLRECIEKPLALAGVQRGEAKSLADEVLRDAGDEPGELALIEMALFKAWRERGKHRSLLDAYKAIGRVEGALGQAADEALDRLVKEFGPAARGLAETVFVRLVVQSASGGVTRRAANEPEFTPEAWRIAQAMATRDYSRLLVVGRGARGGRTPVDVEDAKDDVVTIELAHEQIATQWGQYVRWLRGTAEAAADKQALDRLIARAQEWIAGGRRFWDLAMTRAERADFGGIRARRAEWLSADERAFVDQARRRASLPWLLGGATVIALVVAGTLYTVNLAAQLTEAQAANIWNRLDLNRVLAQREVDAVRELMAAEDKTKLAFAEKLRIDEGLAVRFNRNPWLLTRALVGVSPTMRQRLIDRVVALPAADANASPQVFSALAMLGASLESPYAIEPLLGAIKATNDRDALGALGLWLAVAAGKLDAARATRVIELLLGAIKATEDPYALHALGQGLAAAAGKLDADGSTRTIELLLGAIKGTSDPYALHALGQELAAVAGKLDADGATRVIELLLGAIKATEDPYALHALHALGQGLAAAAGKLDADGSTRTIELLLGAIKGTSDPYALSALAQGLAAVPTKLDADQATRALEPLLGAIKGTRDLVALSALARGLAAVPANLDAGQAKRVIETLLGAIEATSNPFALSALAQGLAAVPTKLDADQATRALEPLLGAIKETRDFVALSALAGGLAAVPANLDAGQATRVIETLLGAIKATSVPLALDKLDHDLAAVAGKFDAQGATRAIELLLGAIKGTSHSAARSELGPWLAAAASKLDADGATRAIELLLGAINRKSALLGGNFVTRDSAALRALGLGLAAAAGRLDADGATRAIEPLLGTIEGTSDSAALRALGPGLAAAVGRLDADGATRALETLLGAIEATSNPFALSALAQGLAAVPTKLDEDQATRVIEPLLGAIKKEISADTLSKLGAGLAAAVSKLDAARATRAIELLLGAIKATSDPDALRALAQGLAAVAAKLDAGSAARVVFEALRNPFANKETVELLVSSVAKRPPPGLGEDADLWKVLAWGAALR